VKVWEQGAHKRGIGRTITLKLKTNRFRLLTRSFTLAGAPASAQALAMMARQLCSRVDLPPATRYRLVGVGMSNFPEADEPMRQADLFSAEDDAA
jgi:DNA polymerase-4